ncbi:hypothetical protein ACIPC1_26610 [Streptomyces sp. NPDC087263]|uniref:hypothetical protein n=1 Tax=Streptomyces sp. NPDC087263 TaxID=3365773 RepID=UPI0037F5EA2D
MQLKIFKIYLLARRSATPRSGGGKSHLRGISKEFVPAFLSFDVITSRLIEDSLNGMPVRDEAATAGIESEDLPQYRGRTFPSKILCSPCRPD